MTDTISTTELVARSGATFRQIEYWATVGVFNRTSLLPHNTRGAGDWRKWSHQAVPVAFVLASIQRDGIRVETRLMANIVEVLAKYPVTWWPETLAVPGAPHIIIDLKLLLRTFGRAEPDALIDVLKQPTPSESETA